MGPLHGPGVQFRVEPYQDTQEALGVAPVLQISVTLVRTVGHPDSQANPTSRPQSASPRLRSSLTTP